MATCIGSISIAIMMLDAGISAEEIPKTPEGKYFSTEEIRKENIQKNIIITFQQNRRIKQKL